MQEDPYLDRGDDNLKMTQIKGLSAKCEYEPRGGRRARTGPERAWVDRPIWTDTESFCGGLTRPFP
jgi:hypothetical protein